MALTQDEIDIVVDPALDRIQASPAVFSPQTDVVTVAANKHYERTRDALLRSFVWPFARKRAELVRIKTLEVDLDPSSAWAVGDTVTGNSSGTTSVILEVVDTKNYVVAYIDGDYDDDEILTNGTGTVDCGTGYPVVADDVPDFEWSLQYELPTDICRVVSINEDDGTDLPNERWTREGNRILTDYSSVSLRYIRAITDPNEFRAVNATEFLELLILTLAKVLVFPLAGSADHNFKQQLDNDIKAATGKAQRVCMMENNTSGRYDWDLARWEY